MTTPNPMADLPPPPTVSVKTVHMAGINVDVYGLDELPPPPATVSMLWLHHGRLRKKEDLADIASRCVSAWNSSRSSTSPPSTSNHKQTHGLLALAFSQRNHGERLVRPEANESWRGGNPTHAQDMYSIISGTVADTRVLVDVVESYLFPDCKTRAVQHLVLGISLGGHCGWQLMFTDERVTAGALIIGCPDFMSLMSHRAKRSKLPTAMPDSKAFLGSTDFPNCLIHSCCRNDPKSIIFGGKPSRWASEQPLREAMHQRVTGKQFLVCSGADDKLVPYHCGEPFLDFLRKASDSWRELQLGVEDNVYPGTGHEFSPEMVKDAVRFVVDNVGAGASAGAEGRACFERGARI